MCDTESVIIAIRKVVPQKYGYCNLLLNQMNCHAEGARAVVVDTVRHAGGVWAPVVNVARLSRRRGMGSSG